MNLGEYKFFALVDLEATCTNANEFPREEREIIEIGAVMVSRETLEPIDEFGIFVKPVRHPVLTEYCTELTSITQDDVESAMEFPFALNIFAEWMFPYQVDGPILFCSWGVYDKNQFIKDCNFHNESYPFGDRHLNIKTKFSYAQGRKKQYGMAKAMRIAQIPMSGTHHRGIDDARNMVKLMPYIVGGKLV